MKLSIRDLMQSRSLPATCCLILAMAAGCGPKVVKDPLSGVGGYKLVYKQREGTLDPVQIARVLRERVDAKDGDVVVRPLESGKCEILLPGGNEQRVAAIKKAIASGNVLQLRIVAKKGVDDKLIEACQDGQDHEGAAWAGYNPDNLQFLSADAAVRTTPDGKSRVLILEGEQPVDAGHLEYVAPGRDETMRPCILCSFNEEGAHRMMKLTNRNPQRQLAIIFDGYVISAPMIQSPFGRQCQLTGNFSHEEIVAMVLPLRQAQMFAVLEPIPLSEIKVSAESEK